MLITCIICLLLFHECYGHVVMLNHFILFWIGKNCAVNLFIQKYITKFYRLASKLMMESEKNIVSFIIYVFGNLMLQIIVCLCYLTSHLMSSADICVLGITVARISPTEVEQVKAAFRHYLPRGTAIIIFPTERHILPPIVISQGVAKSFS